MKNHIINNHRNSNEKYFTNINFDFINTNSKIKVDNSKKIIVIIK